MRLHHYYSGLKKPERVALAKKLGISPAYFHNIAHGNQPSLKLALALHHETNGVVPFHETYPDVDWVLVSRFFNAFPLSATSP